MTAGVTPISAPHGKGFYVTVAVFASVYCCGFVWGAFVDTSTLWQVASAGVAAIFLIGTVQAFERLLAPARAQARSAAITGVARARLRVLSSVLLGMGVAAAMADFAVRVFWGGHLSYISVVFGVFLFAGYLVADICGERG